MNNSEQAKYDSADQVGWKVSDKLTATSIAATFLVSVLSLVLSKKTERAVTGVESRVSHGRVEIDTITSNSDEGDASNPWRIWQQAVSTETMYVGLKRRIQFKQPFDAIPRVATAFGLINVYPVGDRLTELGFRPPLASRVPSTKPFERLEDALPVGPRLRDIHLVSFAEAPDEKGFVLEVGVGLPTSAGKFLVEKLQDVRPPKGFVDEMRRLNKFPGDQVTLSPEEQWLTNFYWLIGTIAVTWTAQQCRETMTVVAGLRRIRSYASDRSQCARLACDAG